MKNFSRLLLGVLAVGLAGCAEPSAQYATDSGYNQVISSPRAWANMPPPTTQGASAGDHLLAAQVRQVLRSSNVADDAHAVNVLAQNGNITLTGSTATESSRQQIDEIVRNVPGVTAVYDQLQIAAVTPTLAPSGYASSPPPTGRRESVNDGATVATGDIFSLHVQGLNDTDRSLAESILHGLRTDTALGTLLPVVNIHVVNGRVVLQGTVENERQRDTIGAVVQRAAGTGNVDNELQVTGP